MKSFLGKSLGEETAAESWELCDRGADQTVVTHGPWAGQALGALVRDQGPALLGRGYPQPRFPLLFKFLDAQSDLSIQVHPDDARAARLSPPDLGKTEAWYILHAEPGSRLFAGLKRGVDRAMLERETARGTSHLCLQTITPRPGDCIFLPAGQVHAIGAGILAAEIQQASDTTYRLFDWNRLGPDGRPRELHLEAGLEAIDFQRQVRNPTLPEPTEHPARQRLVRCEYFVWDRWMLEQPTAVAGDDRCHLLAVVDGELSIADDPARQPLRRGDCVLLPACLGPVTLHPQGAATVLDAWWE